MKNKISKLLFSIFGIVLILYVAVRITSDIFVSEKTEVAYQIQLDETIKGECIAIRNEHIITSNNSSVAVYNAADGQKIAKGAKVIEYYSSEADVAAKKEVESLQRFVDELSELEQQNKYYAADLDSIQNNIRTNALNMIKDIENNDFTDIDDAENELLFAFCSNQLATGKVDDFSGVIDAYEQEIKNKKSAFESSVASVTSPESGYFISSIDGYENCYDFSNVKNMTVSDFESITPSDLSADSVGKVVSSHEWYLAVKITEEQSHLLNPGVTYQIKLSIAGNEKVSMTLSSLNQDKSTGKAVAVFSCSYMNSSLSLLRSQTAQIVIDTHEGLRVNAKAVRVVDGKTGVYVRIGRLTKFREIDIAYSSGEYVIVNSNNGADELRIYDDVIVKGGDVDG